MELSLRSAYHHRMRRFFLVLLIVLVPLRVWAAEGMTVKMAGMQLSAAAMAAGEQVKAMPLDCPMMAKAGGMQDDQQSDNPSQSRTSCQSCQLCMALAAPQTLNLAAPEMIKSGLHIWHPFSYTSADIARDVKPPIA
jgi:hypothetical protein